MKFGLYGINLGPCADPEVSARVALAADGAARYAELGVERLVLLPFARSAAELVGFVEQAGERLVRKFQ